MSAMFYKLGRFLQLAGLLIVPFAISGNIAEKLSLKQSLVWSGSGMLIFLLGWAIQQAGGQPK